MSKKDYGVGVYEERLRALRIIATEIYDTMNCVDYGDGMDVPLTDQLKTLVDINYQIATEGWEE